MGVINPSIPTIGDFNSTEDPDVRNALITIRDEFNGNIDDSNIKTGAGISPAKLANQTPGQFLLANASGVVVGTAFSGDIAVTNAGVSTLGANTVADANVKTTAAITGDKLNTDKGRLKQGTGLIQATSGAAFLGSTYTDVAGATVTFTPDVACYALVTIIICFGASLGSTASQIADCKGTITVDGVAQTRVAQSYLQASITGSNSMSSINTVSQVYKIPLTVAAHTLKLQVKYETDTTGGAGPYVDGANTSFMYQLVAQ